MPSQKKNRVYISGRFEGELERGILPELRQVIGRQGFVPRHDLSGGSEWSSELRRNIHGSYALVLVIGPDWVTSSDEYGRRLIDNLTDYNRMEIETALELGVHVIPFLIGEATMPPAFALPESLRGLPEVKYLKEDVNRDWQNKLKVILRHSKKGQIQDRYVSRFDYEITRIEISNFKFFENFELILGTSNLLEGKWTCIAGINGAGKSSLLQAIALLLLGPKVSSEIGGKRLNSFRRVDSNGKRHDAIIRADINSYGHKLRAEIVIKDDGIIAESTNYWANLQNSLFAGYGASRNVSSFLNRRENHLSAGVDRFISLFDPMSPLNSAESILQRSGGKGNASANSELEIFTQLVKNIFPQEISVRHVPDGNQSVEFGVNDSFHDVSGLPDGYRSSVAWLADLAVFAADLNKSETFTDISQIGGIVLIDEIELHLHATLQRSIVARLRKALPKVQWIITTHSPLVIASFDKDEIVPLDHEFESGIRQLDRQILGLTADEVYEYFFGTPPSSDAAEDLIDQLSNDRSRLEELDAIIESRSEGITSERLNEIQNRLRKLKRENG